MASSDRSSVLPGTLQANYLSLASTLDSPDPISYFESFINCCTNSNFLVFICQSGLNRNFTAGLKNGEYTSVEKTIGYRSEDRAPANVFSEGMSAISFPRVAPAVLRRLCLSTLCFPCCFVGCIGSYVSNRHLFTQCSPGTLFGQNKMVNVMASNFSALAFSKEYEATRKFVSFYYGTPSKYWTYVVDLPDGWIDFDKFNQHVINTNMAMLPKRVPVTVCNKHGCLIGCHCREATLPPDVKEVFTQGPQVVKPKQILVAIAGDGKSAILNCNAYSYQSIVDHILESSFKDSFNEKTATLQFQNDQLTEFLKMLSDIGAHLSSAPRRMKMI